MESRQLSEFAGSLVLVNLLGLGLLANLLGLLLLAVFFLAGPTLAFSPIKLQRSKTLFCGQLEPAGLFIFGPSLSLLSRRVFPFPIWPSFGPPSVFSRNTTAGRVKNTIIKRGKYTLGATSVLRLCCRCSVCRVHRVGDCKP